VPNEIYNTTIVGVTIALYVVVFEGLVTASFQVLRHIEDYNHDSVNARMEAVAGMLLVLRTRIPRPSSDMIEATVDMQVVEWIAVLRHFLEHPSPKAIKIIRSLLPTLRKRFKYSQHFKHDWLIIYRVLDNEKVCTQPQYKKSLANHSQMRARYLDKDDSLLEDLRVQCSLKDLPVQILDWSVPAWILEKRAAKVEGSQPRDESAIIADTLDSLRPASSCAKGEGCQNPEGM